MKNVPAPRAFLAAEWRFLAMLNYEIDPALLRPLVPRGTELDCWQNQTYVSIVGFLFLNTRVRGVAVPLHTNFEEINLRFYVRRKAADGWRRGVCFIREIVPRPAIALVANAVYNERYLAAPMRHSVHLSDDTPGKVEGKVEYSWRSGKRWNRLCAAVNGDLQNVESGSLAEFITEHYWGYAARRDGGCMEYRVEHPRWRVWPATEASFECDVAKVYGPEYSSVLAAAPSSAFVADGSPVTVYRGTRLSSQNV